MEALSDVYRVKTGLGQMVIAYTERRRRITKGSSPTDRKVKKKLKKLREREKKHDVLRKTAGIIERVAAENKAVVVIGGIDGRAKEEMEDRSGRRLRHRIHQWGVSKLIKLLEGRLVHVVRVSERGSSSVDSFSQAKIKKYTPLVISIAVKGGRRVRVEKIVLRIARVNGRVLERDVVGSINIGVRYLSSNGSPVALGSTGTHEVWVKLVNPHRGATL